MKIVEKAILAAYPNCGISHIAKICLDEIYWNLMTLKWGRRENKIKFARQSAALRDRFALTKGS